MPVIITTLAIYCPLNVHWMQGLHLFPLTLCPPGAFSSGLYVIVHQEIIAELSWIEMVEDGSTKWSFWKRRRRIHACLMHNKFRSVSHSKGPEWHLGMKDRKRAMVLMKWNGRCLLTVKKANWPKGRGLRRSPPRHTGLSRGVSDLKFFFLSSRIYQDIASEII